MEKKNIKNFTLDEISKIISSYKEPSYRAKQIFLWLYVKGVGSFQEMKNLPKTLIERLDAEYFLGNINLETTQASNDGTEKFLLRLSDDKFIETVLIYAKDRITVCISTQVGCRFCCPFCASGQNGFERNLDTSEIINQILFLKNNLKKEITNYVFMGIGEPLDNYENVFHALKIMNDPEGMKIGARRITISTCGIIPGILELKKLGLQVNLSISLHAANDTLRNVLVPANKKYPLASLVKACRDYLAATGRIITLEYILIDGRNDSLKDAEELSQIARQLRAKVNLIACNPNRQKNFLPSKPDQISLFIKHLTNKKVSATLRESKGVDIQAACGQLAGNIKQ